MNSNMKIKRLTLRRVFKVDAAEVAGEAMKGAPEEQNGWSPCYFSNIRIGECFRVEQYLGSQFRKESASQAHSVATGMDYSMEPARRVWVPTPRRDEILREALGSAPQMQLMAIVPGMLRVGDTFYMSNEFTTPYVKEEDELYREVGATHSEDARRLAYVYVRDDLFNLRQGLAPTRRSARRSWLAPSPPDSSSSVS